MLNLKNISRCYQNNVDAISTNIGRTGISMYSCALMAIAHKHPEQKVVIIQFCAMSQLYQSFYDMKNRSYRACGAPLPVQTTLKGIIHQYSLRNDWVELSQTNQICKINTFKRRCSPVPYLPQDIRFMRKNFRI